MKDYNEPYRKKYENAPEYPEIEQLYLNIKDEESLRKFLTALDERLCKLHFDLHYKDPVSQFLGTLCHEFRSCISPSGARYVDNIRTQERWQQVREVLKVLEHDYLGKDIRDLEIKTYYTGGNYYRTKGKWSTWYFNGERFTWKLSKFQIMDIIHEIKAKQEEKPEYKEFEWSLWGDKALERYEQQLKDLNNQ